VKRKCAEFVGELGIYTVIGFNETMGKFSSQIQPITQIYIGLHIDFKNLMKYEDGHKCKQM
jgi:hypothetical protein